MIRTFNNQVAVITGAALGLGFSIAKKLSQEGVRLALVDNHLSAFNILREFKNDAESYTIDITNEALVKQTILTIAGKIWQHRYFG